MCGVERYHFKKKCAVLNDDLFLKVCGLEHTSVIYYVIFVIGAIWGNLIPPTLVFIINSFA